jgi:uncharacterized phage protein (TIGR01671 family)
MNRIIEFRGKRHSAGIFGEADAGDWVYGNYEPYCGCQGQRHHNIGAVLVDPSTVGQFTGLKDKNDVKIFEGDILDVDIYGKSNPVRRVVKFFNGAFCVDTEKGGCCWVSAVDVMGIKVIGNIHESKEAI